MGIVRHDRFKKFSAVSIGFTMLLSLGFTGETFAAPKTNKIDIVTEQKLNKDLSKHKINQSLKKTWKQETKRSAESELIHNNGKRIENDVVDKGGKDNLVAVYRTNINDTEYEKYYFSDRPTEDITEIKQEVLSDELNIESKPDQFIRSLTHNKNKSTTKLSSGYQTKAVKPVPKGGIIKSYKYNFYPFGGNKGDRIAVFNSNVEFKRKSSNATVNGKKASIWDVHAYQSYEQITTGRLDRQETILSGNYSDQKLLKYGPKSDSGGNVSVTLGGGGPPSISWTFNTNNFRTSNNSSMDKKRGEWNWYRKFGHNDLDTEPGIRITNTGGNLYVNINHYFKIESYVNNPGNVRASLPDR
ncbi:hypothetical protein [Peribacillus frigoritolerans]|uniref:hypothetical protein n=1 Tax=Peribacillus castrilensis TaxID=2897690 RepID=UPI002DC4DDAF|nr:hypothetical protein [Peribacillus castrilensis]